MLQAKGLIENLLALGRVELLPQAMYLYIALSATIQAMLQSQIDAEALGDVSGKQTTGRLP